MGIWPRCASEGSVRWPPRVPVPLAEGRDVNTKGLLEMSSSFTEP